MTKAVHEQMMIVSMKTEKDCVIPWLIGVAHLGRRRDVGRRAQPRLVGEQAAAQPLRDGRAHAAADRLLKAEGVRDDGPDHARAGR
jgi:hypothetical protein